MAGSKPMIEACITNRGKYVEGELRGEWLKFPADTETVKALLAKIGVDGVLYEEYFITDYKTNLAGTRDLGEYAGIDRLNYLAALLSEMDEHDLTKFTAAAVHGEYSGNVTDLINLTQNLDCYEFYPGVKDYDEFGRYLIFELDYEKIPDTLVDYFDYEAYGEDYVINQNGAYLDSGFIFRNSVDFEKHYDGKRVPSQYRIFAYPDPPEKMPMKQQLEMYGKMTAAQPSGDRPEPKREERT
jgi:antirestriction protein